MATSRVQNVGTLIKLGDATDVQMDHNTLLQTGAITWLYEVSTAFKFTNNMCLAFMSAGNYPGMSGPGYAQGGNGPMGYYSPTLQMPACTLIRTCSLAAALPITATTPPAAEFIFLRQLQMLILWIIITG